MTKADETLLRPFGPLGPWYRVTAKGLLLHRLSLASAPLTLVLAGFAASQQPRAELIVGAAGLVIIVCLCILASRNGVVTAERPPKPPGRSRRR